LEVLQPRSLWAASEHNERVGETWVAPPYVPKERYLGRRRGLDAPLQRPAIKNHNMVRKQCAIVEPTTAPPYVLTKRRRTSTEERSADFWRMRVHALVPSLFAPARASTLPTLHQSSPRCRSLRCVPVNAESYRCIDAMQMPMVAITNIELTSQMESRDRPGGRQLLIGFVASC